MNLEKIFRYKTDIENDLTLEEKSKLIRELLYAEYYTINNDCDDISMYQIARDCVDIFYQMRTGRKFEQGYLKDKIKWL